MQPAKIQISLRLWIDKDVTSFCMRTTETYQTVEDVQADLSLRCSHMSEGTFSLVVASVLRLQLSNHANCQSVITKDDFIYISRLSNKFPNICEMFQ